MFVECISILSGSQSSLRLSAVLQVVLLLQWSVSALVAVVLLAGGRAEAGPQARRLLDQTNSARRNLLVSTSLAAIAVTALLTDHNLQVLLFRPDFQSANINQVFCAGWWLRLSVCIWVWIWLQFSCSHPSFR